MAYSKSELFSNGEQKTANYSKALAHPARVAILKVLAKYHSCLCGEIVAELPLSQSTVSQHLRELKKAGFINGRQSGPSVTYSINAEQLSKAEARISRTFRKLNEQLEQ